MQEKEDYFVALCEWLKSIADGTKAGRAYIDFTRENGDVFRIEYIPNKKGGKNARV